MPYTAANRANNKALTITAMPLLTCCLPTMSSAAEVLVRVSGLLAPLGKVGCSLLLRRLAG